MVESFGLASRQEGLKIAGHFLGKYLDVIPPAPTVGPNEFKDNPSVYYIFAVCHLYPVDFYVRNVVN